MSDHNTQRLTVPAPNPSKPVLIAPPTSSGSIGALGIIITAITCLFVGGASGFFGQRHLQGPDKFGYPGTMRP